MKIFESLQSISAYPIPLRTIESIALTRAVDLEGVVTSGTLTDPSYRLALADLYRWLFFAPNVSQGGQSYSFNTEQRETWRKMAIAIYKDLGEDSEIASLVGRYGYMGSKL